MKKEKIVLLSIFLIGVFLRFFNLGKNPVSMYWDEVAIVSDAYLLKETGRDINNKSWFQAIFASYGDYKAPILIWLTSLTIVFTGMNSLAVRLPIAFFSSLLIILGYYLTKEILSLDKKLKKKHRYLPILVSFLIAISPWSVHFGRIGYESSLSVFWLFLAVYLFLKGVKGKVVNLLLASLTAGISVYSYYSARVAAPLIFLLLGLLFLKKIWKKKGWAIGAIIIFFLLNIPMLKSEYYKDSQAYRLSNNNLIRPTKVIEESSAYLEKYNSSFWARITYHRYWFWLRDFARNYLSHFSLDFLFFSGDSNLRQHSGFFGEFLLVLLPFYLIGLYLVLTNFKTLMSKITLILLLVSPLTAAMVYEIPHASRSIYLMIPLIVVMAWGMSEFWFKFKKSYLALVLLIVLFCVNFGLYYYDYFNKYPVRSSQDWLYSYAQISDYLRDNYQRFAKVRVEEKYWRSDLYFYYQFPESLKKLQEYRAETGGIGLTEPWKFILDNNAKEEAYFVDYKTESIEAYELEKIFYDKSGKADYKLFTKKT